MQGSGGLFYIVVYYLNRKHTLAGRIAPIVLGEGQHLNSTLQAKARGVSVVTDPDVCFEKHEVISDTLNSRANHESSRCPKIRKTLVI